MRPRRAPPSIPEGSALARLAEGLAVRGAIGPPYTGPLTLQWILDALRADGWRPPKASQAEGGRISGKRRGGPRLIRRIVVGDLMNNAPDEYQNNPRAIRTIEWVHKELQDMSAVLGEFSFETIAKDIEDWAYNPATGPRRQSVRGGVTKKRKKKPKKARPTN